MAENTFAEDLKEESKKLALAYLGGPRSEMKCMEIVTNGNTECIHASPGGICKASGIEPILNDPGSCLGWLFYGMTVLAEERGDDLEKLFKDLAFGQRREKELEAELDREKELEAELDRLLKTMAEEDNKKGRV